MVLNLRGGICMNVVVRCERAKQKHCGCRIIIIIISVEVWM